MYTVTLHPPPSLSQTMSLMGVDLLRQQQKWKDTLMDIRHMMASLIQVGLHCTGPCTGDLSTKYSVYTCGR